MSLILLEVNRQALISYRTPKQLTTLTLTPLNNSTKSKPHRSYLALNPPFPSPVIESEIRATNRAQVPTEARHHSLENEIPSQGATIHPKVQVRSTRKPIPGPRLRVAVKTIHTRTQWPPP